MQANLYPKGPNAVPADLTTPSKSYKKHVMIASAALILFMLLYLGLSSWFLYKSYKLFANTFSGSRDGVLSFISALLMAFLGIFMFKALFFISKRDKSNDVEIKKEDQPELFEFIYKVADDANAPRPHKVFLSNTVNACVFYDISIINLIFPTRKNLEIGLGLVNVLNLGEFKSILAHEFGHFAQKSMIIGRWVYIAHKVAYQIVAKRDAFDAFLSGLSRVDFRIAWIGWLLSIIVWSIRAISETFFKLVIITQRALSREMEFHADLVAVSLTGSDALIHSLYKLTPADEAYEEAIEFINKQLKKEKAVDDVFAIQSNSIKHMAVVLNNPSYCASPKLDGTDGSKFKVFKEQIAQAPKMWSTHPANMDREKNAKKIYIKSEVDERSSWILFRDADKIKNKITLSLYKDLKIKTTPLSKEESLELHDKEFQRSFLLPKYRGVYLNRSVMLSFKTVKDMHDSSIVEPDFSILYPETIQSQLEHLKNLDEEVEMLEGLNKKELDANEGRINYRNREIVRKDLPEIIVEAKKEAKEAREIINQHDKLCRSMHIAAAKNLGHGWEEYLLSATTLVHYCEHTQKNIEELARFFYETLAVASKIRNISHSEMLPLIRAANDLHFALEGVFTNGKTIKLSTNVIDKLHGKQFSDFLEPFQLGDATHDNINSWISVVDSWINLALSSLKTLREAALDELLVTEEYISSRTAENVEQAPSPIIISDVYSKYDPNTKREVNQKLDAFSTFYNAEGLFPTIGRLAVAASIILFAVFFSSSIGNSNIVVYNGLPIDVIVRLGEQIINVESNHSEEIQIDNASKLNIITTSITGDSIEQFSPKFSEDSRTYVYNIANGALLYEWVAYYSTYTMSGTQNNNSELIGASRWIETVADYYFEDPPESISLKAGQSETKKIISAYNVHPSELANTISDSVERINFITIHARWEKSSSQNILSWLSLASSLKTFPEILTKRLAIDPFEVASLRMQQEYYSGDEKAKICQQHHQLYAKNTDNPDLYYIKVRCMEDSPQQDSAFYFGYKKWPNNPWLAYASGYSYAQKEEWRTAIECYNTVHKESPQLREYVLEDMKRIYHLLGEDSVMVQLMDIQSPYLRFLNEMENSIENGSEDRLYAYKLLAKGEIKKAIDYSDSDTNLQASILRLASVSDGAEEDIINKALALPTFSGLNTGTIIPAVALLAKKNLPMEAYKEPLENALDKYADTLYKFIAYIKTNNIAEAEKIVMVLPTEMKAKTCLAGVIILGNKAPKKWHDHASGLLFINEKPYQSGYNRSEHP